MDVKEIIKRSICFSETEWHRIVTENLMNSHSTFKIPIINKRPHGELESEELNLIELRNEVSLTVLYEGKYSHYQITNLNLILGLDFVIEMATEGLQMIMDA